LNLGKTAAGVSAEPRHTASRGSELARSATQLDAYAVTGSSPPVVPSKNDMRVDETHSFTLGFSNDVLETIAQRAADMALELLGDRRPYLSIQEAADYLDWPKKRIYNLTSKKEIPHRKHGNRLLFVRAELDQWVANLEGARA
jgi:excisionase family DNA binding protein